MVMASNEASTSTTFTQGGAAFGNLAAGRDININHVTVLRPLADEINASFFNSSDTFDQVRDEVSRLSSILGITAAKLPDFNNDDENLPVLEKEMQSCHKALQDLQELKQHYDGLPSQSKLTWERMGMGTDALTEIRARISSSSQTVMMLTSSMVASSTANMERLVRRLVEESRQEVKPESVISGISCGSLSLADQDAWRQIRKELQSVGVNPEAFDKNRESILRILQETLMEDGVFEGFDFGFSETAPVNSEIISSNDPVEDSTGGIQKSATRKIARMIRDRNLRQVSTKSSILPTVKSLLQNPFNGKKDILDDAEAGDINSVLEKLNRGADIRATRNEETALILASREGHTELVRVLLEAGAGIDWCGQGIRALHGAVYYAHEKVVERLLEEGVPADTWSSNPIVEAAESGKSRITQLLLNYGADANSRGHGGKSLLMMAVSNGQEDLVKILLDHGASAEARDDEGRTALSQAAEKHQDKIVQLLLDCRADANSIDIRSCTPLHWALEMPAQDKEGRERQLSIVNLLLRHGRKSLVKSPDKDNRTPLIYAARLDAPEIIKLLVREGADVNQQAQVGERPLLIAASSNRTKVVYELLQLGANVNSKDANGESALWKAVENANHEMALILLDHGANTSLRNNAGDKVLHEAVRIGDEQMTLLLLERKANLDAQNKAGKSALWDALQSDNPSMLKILLQNHANFNLLSKNGDTPFLFAIKNCSLHTVELLLEHKVAMNVQGMPKRSPLWQAVQANHTAIVNLLLEFGADTALQTTQCGTPLWQAVYDNRPTLVELLLEKGADPNLKIHIGATPLSEALRKDDIILARLLLDARADPNSKNQFGEPLILQVMRAAWSGSLPKLDLLLEHGADPNTCDTNGKTLLIIAFERGLLDIATCLLENGAKASLKDKSGTLVRTCLHDKQGSRSWEWLLQKYSIEQ